MGKDFSFERLERVRIAEKARHTNQHVGIKRVEFLDVALQVRGILRQRFMLVQHQAPHHPALDRARFVQRKIDAAVLAQKEQHVLELLGPRTRMAWSRRPGLRPRRAGSRGLAATRSERRLDNAVPIRFALALRVHLCAVPAGAVQNKGMLCNPREFRRNRLGRQHQINAPGRDGAAGHGVVLRG